MRRHLITVVLFVATAAVPSIGFVQQRAADGVALNDDGLPQYSTFSLCAIDPATGQSGASVTTRVPFVGRAVPHVRAGVGAVCTQASTVVEYGPRGPYSTTVDAWVQTAPTPARTCGTARPTKGTRVVTLAPD